MRPCGTTEVASSVACVTPRLVAQMESDDERASPAAFATMISTLKAHPETLLQHVPLQIL